MTDKVISSNCKSVRTITLQRPKKKNALDAEMFDELTHQLRQAADAQEVKVEVLEAKIFRSCRWLCSLGRESTFQVGMTWETFLLQSQKVILIHV